MNTKELKDVLYNFDYRLLLPMQATLAETTFYFMYFSPHDINLPFGVYIPDHEAVMNDEEMEDLEIRTVYIVPQGKRYLVPIRLDSPFFTFLDATTVISKKEISAALNFIDINRTRIQSFISGHIDGDTFTEIISKPIYGMFIEDSLSESQSSRIKQKDSGLPIEIWPDVGGTFRQGGHSYRIKYRALNNPSHNTRNWDTVMLHSPESSIQGDRYLSSKEKKAFIKFIEANRLNLQKVMNQEMSIDEFQKTMIKVNVRTLELVQPKNE